MKEILVNASIYTVLYGLSVITGERHIAPLSGAFLLLAAIFLYYREYKRQEQLLCLRGLMALGFIGGEGIARFQLSSLSTDWTQMTWWSFYLFYLVFYFVSFLPEGREKHAEHQNSTESTISEASRLKFLRRLILMLLVLTYACFSVEAFRLRMIPLFVKDTPHAYGIFHLKGVHYFTTLVILIPSYVVLYLNTRTGIRVTEERETQKSIAGKRRTFLNFVDLFSLITLFFAILMPVLMVSRFQLMFSVIVAVFTYLLSGRKLKLWQAALMFFAMVLLYVFITIHRAHSVEYLNGIFAMKNPATPIFITQPYMYIANNYDNFNVMTCDLTVHSKGLKMLYPFVTLSALKYFFPSLAPAFPLFKTKEELGTTTILYDAWYDFGIPGVLLFGIVLGLLTGLLEKNHKPLSGTMLTPVYAQVAFYFLFSFFTTWFSLPSTWFYLIISVFISVLSHRICIQFIDKKL